MYKRQELEVHLVVKESTSATSYTDTNASNYKASTGKSSSGSPSLGAARLFLECDLNANTSYYIWLFMGGEQGMTTMADANLEIRGLNV